MPAVPKVKTPLSREGVLAQLRPALEARGVTDPRTIGWLAGIVGIENGGGALIHNHNWGNVMATDGWVRAGRDYWERPHSDPNQPQRFQSLPSHSEGANRFARLITGSRHRGVLEPASRGDVHGMNRALFGSAYITPAVGPRVKKSVEQQKREYREGIERHALKFLPLLGVDVPTLEVPLEPPEPSGPVSPTPPARPPALGETGPTFFLSVPVPSASSASYSFGISGGVSDD